MRRRFVSRPTSYCTTIHMILYDIVLSYIKFGGQAPPAQGQARTAADRSRKIASGAVKGGLVTHRVRPGAGSLRRERPEEDGSEGRHRCSLASRRGRFVM